MAAECEAARRSNSLLSTNTELLSAALVYEQRERAREKEEHQADLRRAREDRLQAMVRVDLMTENMGRVRAESAAARAALAFHVELSPQLRGHARWLNI